jgi:hypothetical protein
MTSRFTGGLLAHTEASRNRLPRLQAEGSH